MTTEEGMETTGHHKPPKHPKYPKPPKPDDVKPGECDPKVGCPPPTEVVCIVVDKVYDECKNVQVNEDEIFFAAQPENPVKEVICKDVELLQEPICEIINVGRVRVTFSYMVRTCIILEDGTDVTAESEFTVVKLFTIDRAGEEGLELQCSIPFLECLQCFVKEEEHNGETICTKIICCIGKYILFKLKARVQLMVPAYGFCPEPPDCVQVIGECPDFSPEWPPFPPQLR